MNAEELRDLTNSELEEKLVDGKEEVFNLRFQLATNQLDNTARLGEAKKEVARIKTVIREQEIEAWKAGVASGSDAESGSEDVEEGS